MSEIKIGDKLPEFNLKDQNGEEQSSQDWIGEPLVIYFYPKDNTPICTAQACSFKNHYDDFLELNARVVGISNDSVQSHLSFSRKHELPFLLLSDSNNKIRKLFGVPKGLFGLSAGRVTYIFDKKGNLGHIHNASLQANEHVIQALNELKKD